jgi:hypothetical protein
MVRCGTTLDRWPDEAGRRADKGRHRQHYAHAAVIDFETIAEVDINDVTAEFPIDDRSQRLGDLSARAAVIAGRPVAPPWGTVVQERSAPLSKT